MSRNAVAKSLQLAILRRLHEDNQLRFSNSKHFRRIEQRNISFQNDISLKTMRLGVLSWEKVKNCETHGRIVSLDQLASRRALLPIFSSCLSPERVKKLQKFINFCLKVGHSANLKHSNSTRRQSSCADFCEMYKISTSRNGNNVHQLSFWYRALSCRADWFTKGVYIWVTYLHIVNLLTFGNLPLIARVIML